MITRRTTLSALLATLAILGFTACSPSEAISIGEETVVLDVRTPEEYASGHLQGAVNIDVGAADFDTRIAELPLDGEYVVYCRSGNRSAAAVDRMNELGFTDVTDAGGLDAAASATGLAVSGGS